MLVSVHGFSVPDSVGLWVESSSFKSRDVKICLISSWEIEVVTERSLYEVPIGLISYTGMIAVDVFRVRDTEITIIWIK